MSLYNRQTLGQFFEPLYYHIITKHSYLNWYGLVVKIQEFDYKDITSRSLVRAMVMLKFSLWFVV